MFGCEACYHQKGYRPLHYRRHMGRRFSPKNQRIFFLAANLGTAENKAISECLQTLPNSSNALKDNWALEIGAGKLPERQNLEESNSQDCALDFSHL